MTQDADPDRQPPSDAAPARAKRSPLVVLFLVVFIDLVGFGIVLPLLPRYARLYDAGGFEQGLLLASFSAMQLLFAPLWGRLSDRVGRRPVLMAGLFGSILAYTVFGLAESYAVLLLSRVAAGIFGATIGTAQAYIADVTPDGERGKGMALIGAAFGIGFTVGPAIGGLSTDVHPSLPGFIAAGLSVVAFALAWFLLPEPARHRAHDVRGVLGFGGFRHVVATPTLILIVGLQTFATFIFASFESTLSLMAKDRFGYDERQNGFLFTYVGLCLVVAQGALVRRYMHRVGELRFVVVGTALLAFGLLGMSWSDTLGPLLVSCGVIVFGFAMVAPSLASLLSRRSPAAIQGEVMGINQSGLSLARVAGPLVGNPLLAISPELPSLVGAGLMTVCFVAALRLRSLPAPDVAPSESAA